MRIKTALLSKLQLRCGGACPLLTRQHAATPLGCTRVIDSQNFSALETPAPSVQGFFLSPTALSKLSVANRAARCPSMVIHLAGKVRSVSAMGQPVNAIRRNGTPRMGSVVMEHLTHQQNLALCRRLLADAELATSSDEIRHSMLMRLLAEEEANGLVMPVTVIVLPNRRAD
jgi:hypothetical protein